MGDSTIHSSHDHAGPAPSVSVVLGALRTLESAGEPAVVFASLVRLCVPAICDAATATVWGPDENVYAASWPRHASNRHESGGSSLTTHFDEPATDTHAAYHGEVALRFGATDCCQPFVAQLLVDRAIATIERERLSESALRSQDVAANLEVALASNREISVAVGILMATHKLTADQSFDLLREASQRSNRKLRAIALEVTRSGVLVLPAGAPLRQPVLQPQRGGLDA